MKKQKISKDRARMIEGAIAYLRFKGYHEIRAPHDGFKLPRAVFLKASEAGYTPDMIAEKDFGTYVFELIDDESLENWDSRTDKWQTFDEYVTRKKGKFYLIAYSDIADAVLERVSKMDFEPGLIKIQR